MDWNELKKLRDIFLTGIPAPDYWLSEKQLALYDETFAQRIRWKWEAVLKQVKSQLPSNIETVLDWGCGTGIATRSFFSHFPIRNVYLFDRSQYAVGFAKSKIQSEHPGAHVESGVPSTPFVLLLSHVLNELYKKDRILLETLCEKAEVILWVEPGTKEAAQRLVEMREKLRGNFFPLAPCTHTQTCGLLESDKNWCHHFAKPPASVFQSAFWKKFSEELGIDLRSLPLSYLVLSKGQYLSTNAGLGCEIGRNRIYKGYLKTLLCDESGVRETRLLKKTNPKLFKEMGEDVFARRIQANLLEVCNSKADN